MELSREDQKWLKIGRWTLIKKGQLEWWGREDINSSLHKSDYCELYKKLESDQISGLPSDKMLPNIAL